jgi:hypothetical protein
MGQAAYATEIRSAGGSVPLTAEPTTALDTVRFQITDSSKRLLDPLVAITVSDGDIESIDYFSGIITMQAAGAVDPAVTGAFLTSSLIGGSTSYSFEFAGDVHDSTEFGTPQNGGYRSMVYGLHAVTVSVDRYDDLSMEFKIHKAAAEQVYVKISTNGGLLVIEGWYVADTANSAGDLGGLETEALAFSLASLPTLSGYAFKMSGANIT